MGADIVTVVIVSAITQGATRVLAAPLEGVADHVKARVKARLDATLANAAAKAGSNSLQYSDRVAAKALNEAAWTDDELMADYLGGVLAASTADDDQGAAVVAQIERLSANQLLLHYLIYRELRRLSPDPRPNLYSSIDADRAGVRIPITDILAILPAPSLRGSVAALSREGLIRDWWKIGLELEATPDHPLARTMQVRPTGQGAELFLWGHGIRQADAARFFDEDLPLVMLTDVPPTPCATLTSQDVLANFVSGPHAVPEDDGLDADAPEPLTIG